MQKNFQQVHKYHHKTILNQINVSIHLLPVSFRAQTVSMVTMLGWTTEVVVQFLAGTTGFPLQPTGFPLKPNIQTSSGAWGHYASGSEYQSLSPWQ